MAEVTSAIYGQTCYHCRGRKTCLPELGSWLDNSGTFQSRYSACWPYTKLCWFLRAAITKYHTLGGLKNSNVFSPSSGS